MDQFVLGPGPKGDRFAELSRSRMGRVFNKQILKFGGLLCPGRCPDHLADHDAGVLVLDARPVESGKFGTDPTLSTGGQAPSEVGQTRPPSSRTGLTGATECHIAGALAPLGSGALSMDSLRWG